MEQEEVHALLHSQSQPRNQYLQRLEFNPIQR